MMTGLAPFYLHEWLLALSRRDPRLFCADVLLPIRNAMLISQVFK